jgi:SAM-dependent methyltransferase
MSGFSEDWLAAREVFDHRARSPEILAELNRWLAPRRAAGKSVRVLDLGCGTGSTARYLTPRLAAPLSWTLVDGDPALLRRACESTGGRPIDADLAECDLSALIEANDLVTASALLDLVSEAWLERLWRAVTEHRAALLAGLSYDGRIALAPADPFDAAIRDLLNRHQRGDKGFGPALGPAASSALAKRAHRDGWRAMVRRSDWRLTAGSDSTGLAMLIRGWAEAALELAPGLEEKIIAWRDRRLAETALSVTVGHRDILALPLL